MTCNYPAPCCCCCVCCDDIPPALAVTFQGVVDTERCDECGFFNNTFLLTLEPEEEEGSRCPRWSCHVEPWPCGEGHAVTISVWLTNPPAELGGDSDECGLELYIDDSSGESVMYSRLVTDLPTDCYNMTLGCGGDCVDYWDINKCCFNAAVVTIQGLGGSS